MARTAQILFLLLAVALLGIGCKKSSEASTAPAPPSYDKRELAALAGSGREIPDGGPAVDCGVNVPDAKSSLFDEALCEEACAHLYEILIAEQREKLAMDTDALDLFLEELERIRPQRERKCVRECRKYADKRAVDCVKAATKREQLDRCDF